MGANFKNSYLERANFSCSNLYAVNFENANLFKANFERANLREVNLENADILGVNFEKTKLERVKIGKNNKIKNEVEADLAKKEGKIEESFEKYLQAEEIYRNLKTNFKDRGLSHGGGVFFYREMIMKRKQMPLFSIERFWSKLVDITCGYGEKPFRIITFSMFFILFNSISSSPDWYLDLKRTAISEGSAPDFIS